MDSSAQPWAEFVRKLLYPVQFDRDPRDGIERVFIQQFGPGTPPENAMQTLDAVREALQSPTSLTTVMPMSHTDGEVRAYLQEVARRLEERLPPAPAVVDSHPQGPPSDGQPGGAAEALLHLCAALAGREISIEQLSTQVGEVEDFLGSELSDYSALDETDMDPALTGRDLVLQGLGTLLDVCSDLRHSQADPVALAEAAASIREADAMIAQGKGLLTAAE